MSKNRDEAFFTALLRLAGVTPAGDGGWVVVETLLGPGRTLLGADGATVLLQDDTGSLAVVGSTGERSRRLAEAGLTHGGPAQLAHAGLHVVSFVNDDVDLWPRYAAEAVRQRIRVVHAVPIAVGDNALGAFTLHWEQDVHLSYQDERYAQSMARMAAVGIVNRREIEEHERRAGQLQQALNSRVVIEQAKGMIAARAGIEPARAFDLIRVTARASGRRLSEVAEDVVRGIRTVPEGGPQTADGDGRPARPTRSRRFRPV